MVATELRVIYGDTDQMGFVYYANYLRYLEAGRNEFIRANGIPYAQIERDFEIILPVAEVEVQYRASARYDDLILVETRLGEMKRASLRFDYRILRGEELLVTGKTLHACVDRAGRIRRLPKALLESFVVDEKPGVSSASD